MKITAITNKGPARVGTYIGHKGSICVFFKLKDGTTIGECNLKHLLDYTFRTLCLDGVAGIECYNILDIIEAFKEGQS